MSLFGFLKKKNSSEPRVVQKNSQMGQTQEIFDFPLGESPFRQLLYYSEQKELKSRLPSLSGCKVLEIAPRESSLTPMIRSMNPALMVRVGGQKEKEMPSDESAEFVLSHWENLPFLEGSWDFILLRPHFSKISLSRILREASRILKSGGMILLSDFHPFSHMIQKEHLRSVVGEDSLGPGFERYFKFFRESGLTVDSVKEFFYDGSLRKFFQTSGNDQELFENLRKTPFLIFFLLQKE
ncbi:MAG: class I SAM-dependent methyltransferase [Deltaproteobacteria bacterium]|nr:MAG: class I SAM-dependent methyltransferase [Deltaproteobacteria bacterium]